MPEQFDVALVALAQNRLDPPLLVQFFSKFRLGSPQPAIEIQKHGRSEHREQNQSELPSPLRLPFGVLGQQRRLRRKETEKSARTSKSAPLTLSAAGKGL